MKKTNKGFSLVELIIVIAIMAILAGALAPALIKYINKSRISTDIQTANSIATAVQSALANEKAYDGAASIFATAGTKKSIDDIYNLIDGSNSDTDQFGSQVKSTLGANAPTVKSKKCMAANASNYGAAVSKFEVAVDLQANTIVITEDQGGHQLYPTASACLTDEIPQCTP